MKISKIKRPNKIQKYLNEQNTVLSEIRTELKILNLKYHKKNKKTLFQKKIRNTDEVKNLRKIIKDLKKELANLRKIFSQLYKISVKYKVKWFNTYKLSLRAGIVRRKISIVHKHLLKVIEHNRVDKFNVSKTVESLKKNYRAFLLINSQAKSLIV
jgi:hypothetical protein